MRSCGSAWTGSSGLALVVGAAGLVVCAAGWLLWPAAFFHAYLVGYDFWVGITLGCLGLTMLHHLVGGGWGLPIRRPMESAGITLLPLAILFLPIALNLPQLYEWARPEEVAHDSVLKAKSDYLNPAFFLGRTGAYFVVWIDPGDAGRPPLRRAGSVGRLRAEPMAGRARRAGADPPVPHRLIRGDRLDDDPRAALGLVDLRRHGGRGRGPGDAGDGGRDRGADVRPPADVRGGDVRAAARHRQPDAGLHHALGLHVVLAVPDHLERQPARGDPLVPPPGAGPGSGSRWC